MASRRSTRCRSITSSTPRPRSTRIRAPWAGPSTSSIRTRPDRGACTSRSRSAPGRSSRDFRSATSSPMPCSSCRTRAPHARAARRHRLRESPRLLFEPAHAGGPRRHGNPLPAHRELSGQPDRIRASRVPAEQGMKMTNKDLVARAEKFLFQNYRTQPIALVRGEGTYVWDADGKRYLDFIGGIATVSVGHANPKVRDAVLEQTKLLWHASNLYVTEPQVRLAEKLVRLSFADRVFFCNSGAEANEAMIKLARRFQSANGHEERIEIVCMNNSFHGRTLGAVAATGQPKYQQGFGPLPAGFRFVDYGDVRQLEAVVNDKTCAVILEPLQGEAGVITAPAGYLKA